jgi:hypothetical protein
MATKSGRFCFALIAAQSPKAGPCFDHAWTLYQIDSLALNIHDGRVHLDPAHYRSFIAKVYLESRTTALWLLLASAASTFLADTAHSNFQIIGDSYPDSRDGLTNSHPALLRPICCRT